MARTKTSVEYNSFTNGFITEASPLTFPENASLDESNININRDGSRQRRFGLDWTDTAVPLVSATTLAATGNATSGFTWKSAGNDGENTIGVLQLGSTVYFHDLDIADPGNSLINSFTLSGSECPLPTEPFEYASANGKLLISGGGQLVALFYWTGATVAKGTSLSISMRDRFGIDDGLSVDARIGSISLSHRYNLMNQGWPALTLCASDATGAAGVPTNVNPIDYTFTSMAFYPSNADLIWSCKLSSISGSAAADIQNLDTFSPWELEKQFFGTTSAPKGKYIIDVFNRGASRITESGIGGLVTDTTNGGISAIASFAGRVWYSTRQDSLSGGDKRSPNLGNMVFYGISGSDEEKWGSCHGENDPTEEDLGDVLDSDGGFITIPESGRIYKLVPMGESLYVVASNGVWEIFGGDTGFSATTQSVVKLTDIGALSNRSIVDGDNVIGYWAESGIYGITIDKTTLRGVATNITEQTIQGYYDDIPISLKKQARGAYDPINRQVTWLYNLTSKESEFYFDKELVLDVAKASFTKRDIATLNRTNGLGPYPTTMLRLRNLLVGTQTVPVTVGGVIVTASGVDVFTTVSAAEQKTKTSLMYWMADNDGTGEDYWLGGYLNFGYKDFNRIQNTDLSYGKDAYAYLITGYLTGGDSSRFKYTPYISVKMKRTESGYTEDLDGNITVIDESGCHMQAIWEWTNDPLSGRWSRVQQVYRLPRFVAFDPSHDFNFDVINTRNKVRGKGRALSLKFSSEEGKDMQLLGWGMDVAIKETI